VLVVAASEGYPLAPRTGDVIEGTEAAAAIAGVTVSAPASADPAEQLVTAGGRVLNVVGTAADPATAPSAPTRPWRHLLAGRAPPHRHRGTATT
jgi:phosphoribosylamine--glycine ligase